LEERIVVDGRGFEKKKGAFKLDSLRPPRPVTKKGKKEAENMQPSKNLQRAKKGD